MSVKSHYIGSLRRETVIDHYLSSACLVEDSQLDAVSKRSRTVSEYDVHILYECSFPYDIIGYIVIYILNAAVVSDSHIMQSRIIDTGMLLHTAWHSEHLAERSQSDLS